MTDLAARYGRTRRPRWVWPTIAAVGILLGVAWVAWVALDEKPVTADVYGYEVQSDTRVVATLEIRRPEPVPVRCTVYAQSLDHSVVGERTIDVAAGREQRERVDLEIDTERRAVNAVLRTCRVIE